MKNICCFNSVEFWGGGEKLHLENGIEFKKKGYNVTIASNPASPLWRRALDKGLNTHSIGVRNLSFLNPIKIAKLIRFYKKQKIDTVIFSTSQDIKLGGISAKLAGVKNIVNLRGLDVPVKASVINRIVYKSILTHIISNSEATKRSILKYLGKYINEDKVHTIYHGIELDKFNKEDNSKLSEIQEKGHGIILGNAGRLTPQKGQENLIKIAVKLKEEKIDFTIFIAGTGEQKEELTKLINKNNLHKDVILLGFVEDVDSFMNSIDIFLLTSIWEGFGFVLVEAMIKSKPTVAFNITSNPEVVTANETGFLVDALDINMFAQKTKELIQNEELRFKMGEAGRTSVLNRFILEDRVSELESYINGNR